MSAEYLITLPDGTTDGPYTEEDLLDMVDADELAAGAICENMETRRRCRVLDLFKVIPPAEDAVDDEGENQDDEADDDDDDVSPPSPAPARWVPAPLPEATATPGAPVPLPLRTIYTGHPSFWMYWRGIAVSLALMAGGWYAGRWENGGLWLAAGWLLGGLWLALVLLRRSASEYRITTRRVEVQRGLLSKSSQEIRIADIRAINVRKSGFAGLLGVGDLIFSSSADGNDDVIFQRTAGAHRLKNRVRRLQDREF